MAAILNIDLCREWLPTWKMVAIFNWPMSFS